MRLELVSHFEARFDDEFAPKMFGPLAAGQLAGTPEAAISADAKSD